MKRERRKDRVEGGLCKCKERKWVHGSVMIDATMLSLHWWYRTENKWSWIVTKFMHEQTRMKKSQVTHNLVC